MPWLLVRIRPGVFLMLSSIERLIETLEASIPPKKIWQKPFDGNSAHYKRLCSLNGADPDGMDLVDYAHDMLYEGTPLQTDLLRFLLPICLKAWKNDLFSKQPSQYGGFVEYFSAALARRTDFVEILGPKGYRGITDFMRDSILDRINQERELHFEGANSSPYQWFYALGSFAVIFADLEQLWTQWWQMKTPGHAVAALQYMSCLIYKDSENPIFSPWRGDIGGGAPALNETDGFIYDRGWHPQNLAFIESTLSVDYIHGHLVKATELLQNKSASHIPKLMLDDFASHSYFLESLILELPVLLSMPA